MSTLSEGDFEALNTPFYKGGRGDLPQYLDAPVAICNPPYRFFVPENDADVAI